MIQPVRIAAKISRTSGVGVQSGPLVKKSVSPVGTVPPGLGSITSATPWKIDIVASVARIGGRRRLTTSKPLHTPASAAAPSAKATAPTSLVGNKSAAMAPETLMTGPTDRSIPLVMITKN